MKRTISILDNLRWGMFIPMVCFLALHTYAPDRNWISKHGFELVIGCLIILGVLSVIIERLKQRFKSLEKNLGSS